MSNVRILRSGVMPATRVYADAVVAADRELFRSQQLVTQIAEVDPDNESLEVARAIVASRKALLTAVLFLFDGTGAAVGADTEDGKVVRAYLIAGEQR